MSVTNPADTANANLALTLPLAGVQLIEASAGTGKTYTLAGIFARLIVERRLQVREILVVTYTRAAADELKARLRERLKLCVQVASCDPGLMQDEDATTDKQFCAALVDAALTAGESRAELLRRLRLAALSLDEAQISTVHAFCQRVLGDYAWAAGVAPPDGELLEDERSLIGAIARDLWRAQAVSADEVAWGALASVAASADELGRVLWELRDEHSVLEPIVATDGVILRERIAQGVVARKVLAEKWKSSGAVAFDNLIGQRNARDFHGGKLQLKSLNKHRDSFAREAGSGEIRDMVALTRYTPDALAEKWNNPGKEFQVHAFFSTIAATIAANDQAQVAQRELGMQLLRDCAGAMRERLARSKRESRRYSYDDLITRLHAAVTGTNGETIAAALAAKFPAALVDECQDSDARQFEIFFALYRGRGLLCLIGDPKQAIYRFRGGDVHAYLSARAQADETHPLTRNFRSTPALVEAIGRLYEFAGDKAFADKEIHFEPVTAAGAARSDDLLIGEIAPAPLHFWQVPSAAGERAASKAVGMVQLAEGCAAEILRLLSLAQTNQALLRKKQDDGTRDYKPLRAEDIAVLVNAHHEAAAMQRALSICGVPSVVISRASVFASNEAADLHLLLRALSDFDEGRLRAALTTRLLGFSLADLEALIDDDSGWRGQIAQFNDWRELWRGRGVLALIERIAEHRAAALLTLEDGERRLTNLLHLAELAQHAATGLDGERALSDWLARRIAGADQDREEEQLRLESDSGRVHIVTLHKSKGLEYPIVFLPFAPLRRKNTGRGPRLCKYRRNDNEVVYLCLGDATDAAAQEIEMREALAERLRLLYVGLTRARVACYVAWGTVGSDNSETPALEFLLRAHVATNADADRSIDVSALLIQLAESAPGLIALSALPVTARQRLRPVQASILAPARQATRRIRELRETHSFSRLSAGARGEERGGAEDEAGVGDAPVLLPRSDIPAALRGARFGTAFHEILEKADFSAWRDWSKPAPPHAQQELIERVLRRHALVGDRASDNVVRPRR